MHCKHSMNFYVLVVMKNLKSCWVHLEHWIIAILWLPWWDPKLFWGSFFLMVRVLLGVYKPKWRMGHLNQRSSAGCRPPLRPLGCQAPCWSAWTPWSRPTDGCPCWSAGTPEGILLTLWDRLHAPACVWTPGCPRAMGEEFVSFGGKKTRVTNRLAARTFHSSRHDSKSEYRTLAPNNETITWPRMTSTRACRMLCSLGPAGFGSHTSGATSPGNSWNICRHTWRKHRGAQPGGVDLGPHWGIMWKLNIACTGC